MEIDLDLRTAAPAPARQGETAICGESCAEGRKLVYCCNTSGRARLRSNHFIFRQARLGRFEATMVSIPNLEAVHPEQARCAVQGTGQMHYLLSRMGLRSGHRLALAAHALQGRTSSIWA